MQKLHEKTLPGVGLVCDSDSLDVEGEFLPKLKLNHSPWSNIEVPRLPSSALLILLAVEIMQKSFLLPSPTILLKILTKWTIKVLEIREARNKIEIMQEVKVRLGIEIYHISFHCPHLVRLGVPGDNAYVMFHCSPCQARDSPTSSLFSLLSNQTILPLTISCWS